MCLFYCVILFLLCYSLSIVSYALSFAFFGAGTGPIHIDNTACDGSEETLLDCAFRSPTNADTHNEDAGALCFNGIGLYHHDTNLSTVKPRSEYRTL